MHSRLSSVPADVLESLPCDPPLQAWWARGQLWLAPRSAYNPRRRPTPLLDCFLSVIPVAPGPEAVADMLERVWPTIPRAAAAEFAVQATIALAAARQYAAEPAWGG